MTLLYFLIFFKESSVKDRKYIHLVLSLSVAVSLLVVDLTLAFWFDWQDSKHELLTRGRLSHSFSCPSRNNAKRNIVRSENAVHVPSALFSILVVYNLLPLTHLWQSTVIGLLIGVVHIIKSFFIHEEYTMVSFMFYCVFSLKLRGHCRLMIDRSLQTVFII